MGRGDFESPEVWRRQDVTHELIFKAYRSNSMDSGFNFVEAATMDVHSDSVSVAPAAADIPEATESAAPYYTIAVTGPVKLAGTGNVGLSFDTMVPTLHFTLDGEGSKGTVTFVYHKSVDIDGEGKKPTTSFKNSPRR